MTAGAGPDDRGDDVDWDSEIGDREIGDREIGDRQRGNEADDHGVGDPEGAALASAEDEFVERELADQAAAEQESYDQTSAEQASPDRADAGTGEAAAATVTGPHGHGGPRVGLIMGSDSDWPTMRAAAEALAEFEIPFEVGVVSAHRTPQRMLDYASGAADRGIAVIIAGAGGAAHLPGMVASATPLPVVGVPVALKNLDGLDSLLSIVQMPAGVPVATVSVGGARNAGLLAVRILATSDSDLRARMVDFQKALHDMVLDKDAALRETLLGD